MSLFFKSPIDIEILLDGQESRKHVEVPVSLAKSKNPKDRFPVYEDRDSVSGVVMIRVKDGKKIEHLGIRVNLIGSMNTIKLSTDAKNRTIDTFLSLSADLCHPGELVHSQGFPFYFKDVEKRYESYRGKNIEVMYFLKVTVLRKSTDIVKFKNFWCYLYNSTALLQAQNAELFNKPVRLDIGIENCLHIEFEYSKSQYSLKDVIMGRICFFLTRIKVKHMEINLIKRELCGYEPNHLSDTTSIRYEIMDGSPVKGETIPIRLFLGGYDLTPNIKSNYFSVKNYLSLVIIDEDNRRYFKQTEIILYRTSNCQGTE